MQLQSIMVCDSNPHITTNTFLLNRCDSNPYYLTAFLVTHLKLLSHLGLIIAFTASYLLLLQPSPLMLSMIVKLFYSFSYPFTALSRTFVNIHFPFIIYVIFVFHQVCTWKCPVFLYSLLNFPICHFVNTFLHSSPHSQSFKRIPPSLSLSSPSISTFLSFPHTLQTYPCFTYMYNTNTYNNFSISLWITLDPLEKEV